VNEDAKARVGPQRHREKKLFIYLFIGLLLPVFQSLNGHLQEDQN